MVDTPNKGYPLQATGANPGTWGVVINSDLISVVDLNLGGRNNKSVAGSSNVTVSASEAQNLYHHLTGTLTGNIDYIFPATAGGDFIIYNNTSGAYSVTVKPSGGTGLVVPQGATMRIFIDPDATAAVYAGSVFLVSGGGLEYTSAGLLQRSALTGDVTASAGSDATTIAVTTTRGDMIYKGASGNTRLAVGAANRVIASNGTDPAYSTISSVLDSISSTQGTILTRGASSWTVLTPGTAGFVLQTNGAAANVSYAEPVVWAAVDNTGVVTTSFGVSSAVFNGVGDYTVNLTRVMSASSWAALAIPAASSAVMTLLYAISTTGARFRFVNYAGTLTAINSLVFMGQGER